MKAANDAPEKRAYVVIVSRGGQQVANYQGLFASITDASTHGMDLADYNGKVIAYPMVERTEDEGRRAFKAGRKVHLGASNEARDGYEKARYEAIIRRDHDAERMAARGVYGDSPLWS